MSGWQPIATAPRDGTRCLVKLPWGHIYEVSWWPTISEWVEVTSGNGVVTAPVSWWAP